MCQAQNPPASGQLHRDHREPGADEELGVLEPGHEQHRANPEPRQTGESQQVRPHIELHRLVCLPTTAPAVTK